MRKRITMLLVSLLAIAGLSFGAPSAALATPAGFVPPGYGIDLKTGKVSKPTAKDLAYLKAISCTANYICFIEHNPPGGAAEIYPSSTTGCRRLTYLEDEVSYIFNSTGYQYGVWNWNTICDSSARGTIYAHSQGGMNGTWNDKISQFKRG